MEVNMKTIKLSLIFAVLITGGLVLMSFAPQGDGPKPWDIPEKYMKMKNPQAADDGDMIKLGKMLYSKHCKSCHGSKGLGDGPKAKQLETFPGDFSTDAFHNQSDGEMYYKSFIGRDEMPNYESKLPDEEERWAVITYMRADFK
jgi:mono/diheme cytochrome c family protein